ncbi:ubiquinol-cytochrome c reductase iron-sulfur subunit [Homoserinibacter sp. GY 40078]|uniref:cytochrome bc1 complex Rieske iron-sulfur subunit n=1 Tax=Homoserinibacter sp. GY 40078 TaxID=2603275 RepID=UPI0011CAE363|nr:Rieske (2Fe-2S) protein [Homoserinibacter sp. GY 40078]TXK17666.1 Rieske 2Fe-2S domain-containing protein [Homoserinibacter sp. GY 40078]
MTGTDGAEPGTAVETHAPKPVSVGVAVISDDAVENPGFPPYRPRVSDLDPAKERQNERRIFWLFLASMVGSVLAVVAYIVFPIHEGDMGSVRLNNLFLGLGFALGLLGIGFGAVHWAKSLMHGHEEVEQRHLTRGKPETVARAGEIFTIANEESGFTRRKLIRNSLIGALALAPLSALVIFRDFAPADNPVTLLKHTLWEEGVRLARDPSGAPIKASDVTLGSVFHVIPENLHESSHPLEEKAKAAVLLMRLLPEDLNVSEGREDWNFRGIVAYSKICTHVGCPVALYEQQTHHLLCPCHQSQFDITREAAVIFGPAKRPLPQLPITVDEEGYLVARSDFHEPVGPSFWERSL